MIDGHGDDAYRYDVKITMNFSSNISHTADLNALQRYLAGRLHVIGSYPEPRQRSLERLIARHADIPDDCVLVTAGATEAIYLTAQTVHKVFPQIKRYAVMRPTFSEYDDASLRAGFEETDTKAAFPFLRDHNGMTPQAACPDNVLRWICHPNNPTGETFRTDDIIRTAGLGGITIVDQSYEDYTHAPVLTPKETLRYENIILLHSMTKTFGIPGLRIGYVTATADMIERIAAHAIPWSVNAVAAEAARFLLGGDCGMTGSIDTQLSEAQALRSRLNDIPGISVMPTDTTFMLAEMAHGTAAQLKHWLATKHGMLIRDCSNIVGLSPRHFRVAARSARENGMLADAIRLFMTDDRLRTASVRHNSTT
ncbi:MAG: aminotransferase class I/II-fold pyridoxal phosphate-dependent enzyme [Prevotella sp.]